MRKCYSCKRSLPDSAFYPNHHNRGGGRSSKCKECDKSAATAWYHANKERAMKRAAQWQKDHPAEVKAHHKKIRLRKWVKVFQHYGDSCVCCGEREPLFLTIDHIENDGAFHRKELKQSNFLNWVVREGYPSGLQIMCINCNMGRYRNGGVCPHKAEKLAVVQPSLHFGG